MRSDAAGQGSRQGGRRMADARVHGVVGAAQLAVADGKAGLDARIRQEKEFQALDRETWSVLAGEVLKTYVQAG